MIIFFLFLQTFSINLHILAFQYCILQTSLFKNKQKLYLPYFHF